MTARKRKPSWAERLLADWGGYVRSYADSFGRMHRISGDLMDAVDVLVRRSSGGHSDPLYANLAAEQRAELSFVSSLDQFIVEYPLVWLRMIVPRYVGIRIPPDQVVPGEKTWRFMAWSEIEGALNLAERDRKACMAQVRQQIEYDARLILQRERLLRRARQEEAEGRRAA